MTKEERNIRRRIAYHLRKAMRSVTMRPMRWGTDDCMLFHADVEIAATGRDHAASWRGRYRTEIGAKRLMGKGGIARVLARLGWKQIDPRSAVVGDVGIFMGSFQGKPGASLVRLLHRGEWIGRNENGWSLVVTADVRKAWRFAP